MILTTAKNPKLINNKTTILVFHKSSIVYRSFGFILENKSVYYILTVTKNYKLFYFDMLWLTFNLQSYAKLLYLLCR